MSLRSGRGDHRYECKDDQQTDNIKEGIDRTPLCPGAFSSLKSLRVARHCQVGTSAVLNWRNQGLFMMRKTPGMTSPNLAFNSRGGLAATQPSTNQRNVRRLQGSIGSRYDADVGLGPVTFPPPCLSSDETPAHRSTRRATARAIREPCIDRTQHQAQLQRETAQVRRDGLILPHAGAPSACLSTSAVTTTVTKKKSA